MPAPDGEPGRTGIPGVASARMPRHIAMIMDGNGRWAESRGLSRSEGHIAGAKTVRRVMNACRPLGIEYLTLYSFSAENWSRPKDEIDALMELCVLYCRSERESLLEERVRVRVIGDREGLPSEVRSALEELERVTAGESGSTLVLAINYAGRAEIVRAARRLVGDIASGAIGPDQIDADAIAARLDTAGIPDPDLLVRTAGEMRVSNFLLWQISYAEIHVTRTLWPDFGENDLHAAIRDYACRQRKFGGLPDAADSSVQPPC